MTRKRESAALVRPDVGDENAFAEVVRLIEQAKKRAYQAVNTELIDLYWKVGRHLFRMRQFYETYAGDAKVSALLRQLPWTHNLIILGQSKRSEEREFYLRMAIRERWSSRELERQIRAALFERAVLNPPKVSPPVRQLRPDVEAVFKDAYVVEFLNLPDAHSETDLHDGLLRQLKDFMIDLAKGRSRTR